MFMQPIDPFKAPLTGTNLIEASAGTGKTHTIASLFLRLILEKKMPVEEILVVTFTKAAASELKERIRNRLNEAGEAFLINSSNPKRSDPDEFLEALTLKYDSLPSLRLIEDALANFDLASIFTIHGFCQKVLYENAFETGALFNTELVTEKTALFQEVADDFWRKNFYNSEPEITAWALKKLKGPESFLKFLAKLKSPHIKIIPDIKKPHIKSLPLYRKELKKVYATWPLAKHEIEELLCSPSLKAGTYGRLKNLPMIESMERFVAAGGPGFPLFKGFQNFTSSKLEKCTKKGKPGVFHPFFDICDKLWSLSRLLEIEMEQYFICVKSEFFKFAKNELAEKKEAANINFFDDLLIKVNNAVKGEGGDSLAKAIRQKYQAALVDEFQDTDLVQYEIFSKLFSPKDKTIFMIGDPKQAIYGFRGADIFSYIKASEDADNRFTLKKNWRSDPGLITAVNTLFSNVSNPFIFNEIPFICSDSAKKEDFTISAPFNLWYLPSENGKPVNKPVAVQRISNAVAKEISHILLSSPVSEIKFKPGNIAVLVRTNAQAQIIKDALVLKNIPSVLYNADSVFHSHEAEEIERILAGIGEPDNERMLRAALITDIIGVSGEDLDLAKDDSIWWNRWFSRFITYNQLWTRYGFIRMFKSFIFREKVKKRILSYYDGERRLTNILHLAEILQKESEKHSGITGLLTWLSEKISNTAAENEEHQLRLESDEDSVKIVTIHKSKGMEYDVVFCPFGWDGSTINDKEFLFHENNKAKSLVFDIGSNEREKNLCLARNELLAENIRLLYVSLTRAKKRCYMAWGRINKSETSSMAYILHNRNSSLNSLNEDIADKLKKQLSSKTDDNLIDDLKDIALGSSGTIKFSFLPLYNDFAQEKNVYEKEEDKKKYLKKFTGKIDTGWKISSYSSIISGTSANKHDSDRKKSSEISGKNDIFSFPAGAHAGIFFHDIFEHLDFTVKDSEKINILVKNRLNEYGFDPAWDKTVVRMIKNVISTLLFSESAAQPSDYNLKLSCIESKDRLNEMEFCFPLNRITPEKLKNIFAGYFQNCSSISTNFSEQMGRLNFSTTRGFMKGFIDLIFFYENKFYIVDWKSNLLGRTIEDYNQERLLSTMNEDLYFLQYHLYTLAVHQYLKTRIPDYNYEKNFGGVFYIFIRGVNPDKGPLFGIYNDMPKIDLVDRLEHTLIP